jgi:hypothetical protein
MRRMIVYRLDSARSRSTANASRRSLISGLSADASFSAASTVRMTENGRFG